MKQSATIAVDELLAEYKEIEDQNVKSNISAHARQQFQTECQAHKEKALSQLNDIFRWNNTEQRKCSEIAGQLQTIVNRFEEDLQCELSKLFVQFRIAMDAEPVISWDRPIDRAAKRESRKPYDPNLVNREIIKKLRRFIQCSYRYIEKNENVVAVENERIKLEKEIDGVRANVEVTGAEPTRILGAHLTTLNLVSNYLLDRGQTRLRG